MKKQPSKVIVVMLRQPRMNVSTEMRSDPFWEFGSFGMTGCHQRNLMHPGKAHELVGARFAFVQGGKAGQKLVFLTPPVSVRALKDRSEVTWPPAMPFRYDEAPIILDSAGHSDVPSLRRLVDTCRRNGWMGKFASKFRTRREPLPQDVADEMIAVYSRRRSRKTVKRSLATTYEQALPVTPPLVDRNRAATYAHLCEAAK